MIADETTRRSERSWWDLWNTSHRINDQNDPVSSELFERTADLINQSTATKDCRVMEIGCGTGTLSRLLKFSNYHGIDLSAAAIELAKQKAQAGRSAPAPATYEAADIHEWPLPSTAFDVVVCVDAIAYFYDQPLALRKIEQMIRPSGRFILTTINPFVYNRIRRNSGSPLKEGSVSRWLARDELHKLIQQAGLTVERSYTIMPRGEMGILRLINSRKLNQSFGPAVARALTRLKETVGLGQYRIVVARKGIPF